MGVNAAVLHRPYVRPDGAGSAPTNGEVDSTCPRKKLTLNRFGSSSAEFARIGLLIRSDQRTCDQLFSSWAGRPCPREVETRRYPL